MFTKAFTPEQSALGNLENQQELMVLYIKEFREEAFSVNSLDNKAFTYNWFHNTEENSYILQAIWQEDLHIAIKFDQQHFHLLAHLIEPRTIVVSTVPIQDLITPEDEENDIVSFELSEEVITLTNIAFEDPTSYRN